MMHSFMYSGCSGTQHEDCVRLLQRLQSAVHQPSTSSSSENCAAAASDTADTSCELPQDRLDAFPCSMPACSSLLTVQNAETQGRQLAVTQDTAAGTVLWKEEPFVHLLLKQHRKQVRLVLLADRHALQCPAVLRHCHHSKSPCSPAVLAQMGLFLHTFGMQRCRCASSQVLSAHQQADQLVLLVLQKCSHCLKPLPAQAWYSCQACPLVRYCTPKCRDSNTFHIPGGAECGLPWTLLLPSDVVLAVRMANKTRQVVSCTVFGCMHHLPSISCTPLTLMPACLSFHPYTHPSVCLSVCLSVRPSVCPSVCMSDQVRSKHILNAHTVLTVHWCSRDRLRVYSMGQQSKRRTCTDSGNPFEADKRPRPN